MTFSFRDLLYNLWHQCSLILPGIGTVTLDFKTLDEVGPSLISIVKPFVKDKTELNLLSTYLTNRHAVPLAKRGKETGVDI